MRRGRPGLGAVLLATLAAGCGPGVHALDLPPPPPTVAATAPVIAPPVDGLTRSDPTVPAPPTTAVALRPGTTTLTGTALGPSGPLAGATVELVRLVGDNATSVEVVTGPHGRWRLAGVLGGRWQLRAWSPPRLALPTPLDVFVGPGAHQYELQLQPLGGPAATAAVTPDPPVAGRPASIAVEISVPTVDAAGTVAYRPDAGVTVTLTGGWIAVAAGGPAGGTGGATGTGTARTGPGGAVVFTAACVAAGPDPVGLVVGGTTTLTATVPACAGPASPPPTSPPTTAPAATGPPTTAPATTGPATTAPAATSTTTRRRH